MSSSDIHPRERLIDSKTMLPVKGGAAAAAAMAANAQMPSLNLGKMSPGSRRSFLCRYK